MVESSAGRQQCRLRAVERVARVETFISRIKQTSLQMGLLLSTFIVISFGFRHGDLIVSLLVGGIGSFVYFFLLAYRVHKAADMHPLVAIRYMRAGLGIRLVFISAIVLISLKLPSIKIIPMFVGLFTYQLVLHFEGCLLVFQRHLDSKRQNGKRKG
jgi:hypothetical protein